MLYFQLLTELVFLTQSLMCKSFMLIVKHNFTASREIENKSLNGILMSDLQRDRQRKCSQSAG